MIFFDEAFEKAALKQLRTESVECEEKLSEISVLCVIGACTLKDLLRFPNLTDLTLTECKVKDASSLRMMTGLTRLSLHKDTGIASQDIAPLIGLQNLWIDRCGEMDIGPLSALTELKQLAIWSAGIRDLTPLKGMTQMEDLSIHDNPVEDLSPLRTMKRLTSLTVDTDHLNNRRILLEKPFSYAYKGCTDFPENAPKRAKKKSSGRTKLTYLANVHPRLPFCRDAALFKLTGGQERLVLRDYGEKQKEDFDLYLDDKPLAEIFINKSVDFSCHFRSAFGDGLRNEPSCKAVQGLVNERFDGLKNAEKYLEPYIGLMESGLYVAADFDLFPVCRNGGKDYDYFWDMPEYCEELHFCHLFVGGGTQELRTPLFLAPTIRPADMSVERVKYYQARLKEGNAFPRAIALFLNGGVALLLDGHHKACACAMEGRRLPALVIYRLDDQKGVHKAENAYRDEVRLYLEQVKGAKVPVAVCDGKNNVLGNLSCLEDMKKTRLYVEPVKIPKWGKVPDEMRSEHFSDYPTINDLEAVSKLKPSDIRRMIEEQMMKPRGGHDMGVIHLLRTHAAMFQDSKWLSPSERAWLSRPNDQFEDYGFEIERPD